MPKYIDAHCHFNHAADYGAVADVVGFVCNSTCAADWCAIIDAAARMPAIYPCVGVHPWYVAGVNLKQMADILATYPNVMVGEIGIDRTRDNFDLQCEIFTAQMELAAKYNRVAHVHCVRAWDVMLNILKNISHLPPKIVFHEFGGGADVARQLIKYDNVYFSYGPRAVNKIQERIADVPMDKILVETDNDDPNAATKILSHAVGTIAQIKSMDAAAVADIIYDNTVRTITNE